MIGTSLNVPPFAYLPDQLNTDCVRLLINREPVGPWSSNRLIRQGERKGEDLYLKMDADDSMTILVEALGIKKNKKLKKKTKATRSRSNKIN